VRSPARCTLTSMATGGAQSIPGVTLHEAYWFETRNDDKRVEGFAYKALPRRIGWEARIEGTAIRVRAESRREAVELALAQVTAG
jgi:hypothetical protein